MRGGVHFLIGALIGAIFAVTTSVFTERSANATHVYSPPRLLAGLHGTGPYAETYTMCSDDPVIQQLWAYGPEIWEQAVLGDFTLSYLAGCTAAARVVIQWLRPLPNGVHHMAELCCAQ
jgi:hypothetical protein